GFRSRSARWRRQCAAPVARRPSQEFAGHPILRFSKSFPAGRKRSPPHARPPSASPLTPTLTRSYRPLSRTTSKCRNSFLTVRVAVDRLERSQLDRHTHISAQSHSALLGAG